MIVKEASGRWRQTGQSGRKAVEGEVIVLRLSAAAVFACQAAANRDRPVWATGRGGRSFQNPLTGFGDQFIAYQMRGFSAEAIFSQVRSV